jgi:hypothetical protein
MAVQLIPSRGGLATAGLCIGSIVLGVGLGEASLRAWERFSARDRLSLENAQVRDPVLVFRIAPNAPGHDGAGFRNRAVPVRTEILAAGDSQTWGINVPPDAAWPQVLGRRMHRSVYQMAHGGYGPMQYLALVEEGARLRPDVVILGLYLGNDLWDAYRVAYTEDSWRRLRLPSSPPEWLDDQVGRTAEQLWREERRFIAGYRGAGIAGWAAWLRGHSALGRLIDRLALRPGSSWQGASVAWARAYPDRGATYSHETCPTVFTVANRLTALDLEEARIAEGLRLTQASISEVARVSEERQATAVVLLIPTKETVYAPLVHARDRALTPQYARLVQMEAEVRERLLALCADVGIAAVDPLPALRQAIGLGRCPYPADRDGHMTAIGYDVIAVAVEAALHARAQGAWLGAGPRP